MAKLSVLTRGPSNPLPERAPTFLPRLPPLVRRGAAALTTMALLGCGSGTPDAGSPDAVPEIKSPVPGNTAAPTPEPGPGDLVPPQAPSQVPPQPDLPPGEPPVPPRP
ncbi:hypothetical protein [Chondromyces apiculatus]|uniref:Uncharacterized protein n=1 Tax=Chondromyces apiculatus DSM 436 TaxID=1192034 RepID=A0A017TFT4_9BACT|nr:hypothetical protein [Chondromyces apiculatus]EYF07685.1 Hypothetical protein CAP_8186 [Chondromyces apiculatus DSM 436]